MRPASARTARRATVRAGESSKSLEVAARLYDEMADWPADRATAVVAVGGGVVGDLAGFVASTYNRGLPLVMVPTDHPWGFPADAAFALAETELGRAPAATGALEALARRYLALDPASAWAGRLRAALSKG